MLEADLYHGRSSACPCQILAEPSLGMQYLSSLTPFHCLSKATRPVCVHDSLLS